MSFLSTNNNFLHFNLFTFLLKCATIYWRSHGTANHLVFKLYATKQRKCRAWHSSSSHATSCRLFEAPLITSPYMLVWCFSNKQLLRISKLTFFCFFCGTITLNLHSSYFFSPFIHECILNFKKEHNNNWVDRFVWLLSFIVNIYFDKTACLSKLNLVSIWSCTGVWICHRFIICGRQINLTASTGSVRSIVSLIPDSHASVWWRCIVIIWSDGWLGGVWGIYCKNRNGLFFGSIFCENEKNLNLCYNYKIFNCFQVHSEPNSV